MTLRTRLERFVDIKPVIQEDYPDAHHVFLQVTNQRFCVTPYACETKEDAEWTKDMLLTALEKVVREVGGDGEYATAGKEEK